MDRLELAPQQTGYRPPDADVQQFQAAALFNFNNSYPSTQG
jgi:hypothetical protein